VDHLMSHEEKAERLAENLRVAMQAMADVAGFRLANDAVMNNSNIAILAAALTVHDAANIVKDSLEKLRESKEPNRRFDVAEC
jgi:cell fate (sporulation/competence/biofilm development) regulator YmcA (YheA/YmcA/DUF963 family)